MLDAPTSKISTISITILKIYEGRSDKVSVDTNSTITTKTGVKKVGKPKSGVMTAAERQHN